MPRSAAMVAGLLMLGLAWPVSANWQAGRERLRQQRAELRDRAGQALQVRASAAEVVIAQLVAAAEARPAEGCREDLVGLLAGLARMGRDVAPLYERVRVIDTTKAGPADSAAWAAGLAEARRTLTEPAMELLQRAARAGVADLAVAALREVMAFDPDDARVRGGLGQVKVPQKMMDRIAASQPRSVGEEPDVDPWADMAARLAAVDPEYGWFSRFDASMLRRGLVWDTTYGWINPTRRDGYERGGFFDPRRRRWVTMRQANEDHADRGNMWEIRTEHLLVRGTADLEVLVAVATRLEAFYDVIFATLPGFFADSRRHDVVRLALGLGEHAPLKVYVFRDREQYLRATGAPEWSVGAFMPAEEASYFFGGTSRVMYHEFTHQVLHLFTGGNRAPNWLTEGMASYCETPAFEDGTMRFRGAAYSAAMGLDELFAMRTGRAWQRKARDADGGPGVQYAVAASVVTFSMDGGNGRFRDDFIDYLRDAYRGSSGKYRLWDYLGMDRAAFEALYRQWGATDGAVGPEER